MKKLFLIGFFALLLVGTAYSTTINIQGSVKTGSGDPVSNANVSFVNSSLLTTSTLTDSNGYYNVSVGAGSYDLNVEKGGVSNACRGSSCDGTSLDLLSSSVVNITVFNVSMSSSYTGGNTKNIGDEVCMDVQLTNDETSDLSWSLITRLSQNSLNLNSIVNESLLLGQGFTSSYNNRCLSIPFNAESGNYSFVSEYETKNSFMKVNGVSYNLSEEVSDSYPVEVTSNLVNQSSFTSFGSVVKNDSIDDVNRSRDIVSININDSDPGFVHTRFNLNSLNATAPCLGSKTPFYEVFLEKGPDSNGHVMYLNVGKDYFRSELLREKNGSFSEVNLSDSNFDFSYSCTENRVDMKVNKSIINHTNAGSFYSFNTYDNSGDLVNRVEYDNQVPTRPKNLTVYDTTNGTEACGTYYFDWRRSKDYSGIKNYTFQESNTSSFDTITMNKTSSGRNLTRKVSKVMNGSSDGKWFYRVFAIDNNGLESNYSRTRNVTVDSSLECNPNSCGEYQIEANCNMDSACSWDSNDNICVDKLTGGVSFGTNLLGEGTYFDFSTGEKLYESNDDTSKDLRVNSSDTKTYFFEGDWKNNISDPAEIQYMNDDSLDTISSCPETGYSLESGNLSEGGSYCLRTREGKYGKFRIVDTFDDENISYVGIRWAYQPNGSSTFPNPKGVEISGYLVNDSSSRPVSGLTGSVCLERFDSISCGLVNSSTGHYDIKGVKSGSLYRLFSSLREVGQGNFSNYDFNDKFIKVSASEGVYVGKNNISANISVYPSLDVVNASSNGQEFNPSGLLNYTLGSKTEFFELLDLDPDNACYGLSGIEETSCEKELNESLSLLRSEKIKEVSKVFRFTPGDRIKLDIKGKADKNTSVLLRNRLEVGLFERDEEYFELSSSVEANVGSSGAASRTVGLDIPERLPTGFAELKAEVQKDDHSLINLPARNISGSYEIEAFFPSEVIRNVTPPFVNITSPGWGPKNTDSVILNVTYDENVSDLRYSVDRSSFKRFPSGNNGSAGPGLEYSYVNITNDFEKLKGGHGVLVGAKGPAPNFAKGKDFVGFGIFDAGKPSIDFINPDNNSIIYENDTISFDVSPNGELDSVKYGFDGQPSNDLSKKSVHEVKVSALNEGNHNISVFANNTFGKNITSELFFSINNSDEVITRAVNESISRLGSTIKDKEKVITSTNNVSSDERETLEAIGFDEIVNGSVNRLDKLKDEIKNNPNISNELLKNISKVKNETPVDVELISRSSSTKNIQTGDWDIKNLFSDYNSLNNTKDVNVSLMQDINENLSITVRSTKYKITYLSGEVKNVTKNEEEFVNSGSSNDFDYVTPENQEFSGDLTTASINDTAFVSKLGKNLTGTGNLTLCNRGDISCDEETMNKSRLDPKTNKSLQFNVLKSDPIVKWSLSSNSDNNGGNDGSSGGGGGGGSSSSTVESEEEQVSSEELVSESWNSISEGESKSINIKSKDLSFNEVSFTVNNELSNVEIGLEGIDDIPYGAPSIDNKYEVIHVIENNIVSSDVDSASIRFSVEEDWIESNGFENDDIVLNRLESDGWNSLTTNVVSSSNNEVVYESSSPGLSYFVITGDDSTTSINEKSGDEEVDDSKSVKEGKNKNLSDTVSVEDSSDSIFSDLRNWGFLGVALLAGLGVVLFVLRSD